jgi:hypothetical protein
MLSRGISVEEGLDIIMPMYIRGTISNSVK